MAVDAQAVRARLFDEMSDAILIADDTRRYVDVNPAACALFGLTRDQLLASRIDDVMPAPPSADTEALWKEFLREGTQTGEFPLPHRDGTIVVEYRARAHIAPNRHLSVLRDVTRRVRAVEAARSREKEQVESAEAAERARAILDALLVAAPVGFGFLDRDLRFQAINRTLAAINGLPVEAHIGRTPMEILPGLAAEFVRRTATLVFTTGEPQLDLELKGETPAQPGVERTWVEHWYPVRVHDQIIGIGIVVEEVTEKRRTAAQLREASELRDRLMAVVSHDLRNPLGAIATAANLVAANAAEPERVATLATRILSASTRMTSLIEQLMDFVRVDQGGGLVLRRRPLDLGNAVRRAVEECALAFPQATIDVRVVGDTTGSWDDDRILQLLANLLSNAVQHGQGLVQVRVDGEDPQVVRVEVENASAPLPPDLVPIIFDPFRRAAGDTRHGGLGLGLHISKSVVEAHGGTIGVHPSPTSTLFTFTLPRS